MTYVKGKISELFDKLPSGVQSFIYAPATDKKIADIGAKYSLDAEQTENLTDETQYVIIGYKPETELPASIQKSVGVPDKISRFLASDISEQIIKPARELAEKTDTTDNKEEPPEFISNPTEEVDNRYNKLPEDVREAITSVGVALKISELAKKYRLHIDKADELSDETGLVMLGLTRPQDYLVDLKKRLEIPEDMARELVADVNEQIFKPIRESLKKIHEISKEASSKTTPESDLYGLASKGNVLPSYEVEPPILNRSDQKIFADSGIEIEQSTSDNRQITNGDKTSIQEIPSKAEILDVLENPEGTSTESSSLPAGFTLVKNTSIGKAGISSPSQKLTGITRPPMTESSYESNPPLQSGVSQEKAREKYASDPYREPIV